ncbi:MAG: hypothetical protein ACK559_08795, partial [bacterium]
SSHCAPKPAWFSHNTCTQCSTWAASVDVTGMRSVPFCSPSVGKRSGIPSSFFGTTTRRARARNDDNSACPVVASTWWTKKQS